MWILSGLISFHGPDNLMVLAVTCCIKDVETGFESPAIFPWIVKYPEVAILPSASIASRVHLLPGASEDGIQVYVFPDKLANID